MLCVQIVLKINVTQFIAIFKFAIIFSFFLNRIVSQVHKSIAQIVDREFTTRRAQVSLLVKVALHSPICACHHGKSANVKLASVDQQRIVNVLLHDASALLGSGSLLD